MARAHLEVRLLVYHSHSPSILSYPIPSHPIYSIKPAAHQPGCWRFLFHFQPTIHPDPNCLPTCFFLLLHRAALILIELDCLALSSTDITSVARSFPPPRLGQPPTTHQQDRLFSQAHRFSCRPSFPPPPLLTASTVATSSSTYPIQGVETSSLPPIMSSWRITESMSERANAQHFKHYIISPPYMRPWLLGSFHWYTYKEQC